MTPHFPADALCATLDPHDLYPFHPDPSDHEAIAEAKLICRQCPVAQSCLEYALTHRDDFAILGGTTPEERRAMTGKRRQRLFVEPIISDAERERTYRQVAQLTAEGRSAAAIGVRVGLSPRSVVRVRSMQRGVGA